MEDNKSSNNMANLSGSSVLSNENHLSGFDNFINNIDKELSALTPEYNAALDKYKGKAELNRWANKGILGLLANLTGFTAYSNTKEENARMDLQSILSKKDFLQNMYANAKLKKMEMLTSIEAHKNRYVWEKEALKKVGINNPYFMLRNGVLSPFGNNSNIANQPTNYTSGLSNFINSKNEKDSSGGGILSAILKLLLSI